MLSKKRLYHIISLIAVILLAFGAKAECDPAREICNPLKVGSFKAFILLLTTIILKIGMPLAGLMIIISGFLFVTAGGNEEKLKNAKSAFYWTVIGTAVIIGAYAIASAIVNFASGL